MISARKGSGEMLPLRKVDPQDSSSSGDDSRSESAENRDGDLDEDMNAETRALAAQLIAEVMFLHKRAFEAESADAAQDPLDDLREKIKEISGKGPAFQSPPFGGVLSALMHYSIQRKASILALSDKLIGVFRDPAGLFFRGTPVSIEADSWMPLEEKECTSSKFHRDGSDIVETTHDGRSIRRHLKPKNGGRLLVAEGDQSFLLHPYFNWDPWAHFDILREAFAHVETNLVEQLLFEAGYLASKLAHALTLAIPPGLFAGSALMYRTNNDLVSVESAEELPRKGREIDEQALQAQLSHRLKTFSGCVQPGSWQHFWNSVRRHLLSEAHPKKTEVCLFYCFVDSAFSTGSLPPSDTGHREMLMSLEALPDDFGIFKTPFGNAVASVAWENAYPFFCLFRIVDILLQIFLSMGLAEVSRTAFSTRHAKYTWHVAVTGLLMLHNMVTEMVAVISVSCIWLKKLKQGLPFPLATILVFRFAVEVYCMGWVLWQGGAWLHGDTKGFYDAAQRAPNGIPLLIFIKFVSLMLSMLCLRRVRHTILPTWFAITDWASIMFIIYMLILTFGCSLAYMALPYASKDAGSRDDWFTMYADPFFTMFRLNIIGDFSISELRNDAKAISAICPPNATTLMQCTSISFGSKESTDLTNNLGVYLKLWVGLLALIFPVIFLNVYVGLICDAYAQAKDNLVQKGADFMSASIQRELAFWQLRITYCPHRRRQPPRGPHTKGVLILMPKEMVATSCSEVPGT
eukprot:CAMPEP_0204571028 /NCGR_PEP_ID=MMETSP0661-20131031/38652_1 /ASSEMBLY_ACC=CAM_ASM_000606 /TAXON_ID=109239 /ORGANISM="Alexandrium margalefi, Strain AMGDE01CS-322" /LENGTH=745 /DNA_ID=CAMNT_0051579253 /DNA_START=35 /DNA_END=2272 /DNA_ORIENTATION=-